MAFFVAVGEKAGRACKPLRSGDGFSVFLAGQVRLLEECPGARTPKFAGGNPLVDLGRVTMVAGRGDRGSVVERRRLARCERSGFPVDFQQ